MMKIFRISKVKNVSIDNFTINLTSSLYFEYRNIHIRDKIRMHNTHNIYNKKGIKKHVIKKDIRFEIKILPSISGYNIRRHEREGRESTH